MICEKILGKVTDPEFNGKNIDYVELEWHETYNRILRKTSRSGRDIAIRMGDEILKTGMKTDDVIAQDKDGTVIAVDVAPVKIITATVIDKNPLYIAKTAYEIGNCHAPLFAGKEDYQLVTIFTEPMEHMLSHLDFIQIEVQTAKLDFTRQLSSIIGHGHHHQD